MASAFAPALKKLLKDAGCEVVRNAKGSHTLWESPVNRHRFPVPRRVDNRGTANGILKQAGLEARL